MRRTAPFRGRVGCAVSSRTRPRYPGAIEVSPVNDASYTILRRPTALDGVHSTRLTEVTRSEFSQPMPCASGDGESPSPTNNHTFDRRGTAYRARGVRFGGAREYALPDGSTAEGGGDDKIPKKKEQKRVHWEEDDRLVTVHTLPSQSSSPMKVVPESHQKEEDQHEACVSPTDSTSENQSDEAIVLTEEEETQEEEGESPLESDCEALEQAEDSTVATYHEEEDWESECRPPAECSSVMQLQGQSTVPSGGQDEEQRQCAEEAPAAKQCQSKKKVTEEAWMRECAPLMDCSPYTKRKPETIVTKEHHGEQCHNQAEPTSIAEALSLLAARMQTNQDTSSSDDECFWDDDDDLSDDEPTVIIRLNPSPEEEKKQTSLQNQRQQQAPTVTSEASTQVNLSAQPTEANLYVSQCATQSFQETETAVEVYGGQEYSSSEATASSSTVEMVPVVSYLCFPVLTYQPCTVDTSSATDLPIESSQPYDVLTATQDLSLMYQPCTVETFSATDLPIESSQPYDALTATQDLSKEDRWQVGFPAGHLEARQTRFVPATTEWPGVQDLKPDCIRTPDTESEDNSSGGMAVAEVPHTEEKHLNNGKLYMVLMVVVVVVDACICARILQFIY
ncbi:uncharacterized protein LOC119173728 isoform X2 [Rhipicephalus microplus]|uniref:uncharacterized protein LOC119173728 isoform X2 n=1 Tax=Rhipicephalus microplus TaxID=6941 RepID=UPI003F6D2919